MAGNAGITKISRFWNPSPWRLTQKLFATAYEWKKFSKETQKTFTKKQYVEGCPLSSFIIGLLSFDRYKHKLGTKRPADWFTQYLLYLHLRCINRMIHLQLFCGGWAYDTQLRRWCNIVYIFRCYIVGRYSYWLTCELAILQPHDGDQRSYLSQYKTRNDTEQF